MSQNLIVSTINSVPCFLQTGNNVAVVSEPETWIINETPVIAGYGFGYTDINFNTNEERYTSIRIFGVETPQHDIKRFIYYYYGEHDSTDYIVAYADSLGWTDQAYRTVTFSNSPSGTLSLWLEYNAVRLKDYLCFTGLEGGTSVIVLMDSSSTWTGSYSFDGATWIEYIPGTTGQIELQDTAKVYFKGLYTDQTAGSLMFYTSMVTCSGNIMSLCCGDSFENVTTLPYERMFAWLFYNCGIITPPKLPATILTSNCYSSMFEECYALEIIPALPATTLAEECYRDMFRECRSLTISNYQDSTFQYEWRIPSSGIITSEPRDWNSDMLSNTGGECQMPQINTTYYTNNPPIQ